MKNIILIAAPAAGKGTQAEMLKEKYGYAHISTGDLLREVAASGTPFGEEIKAIMASGALVSDEIVFKLLEDKINSLDQNQGYILDGFPRNVNQAIKYDELLTKLNRELGAVVVIDIDKEVLMKRVVGRRQCRECGAIYNIYNPEITPKTEGVCDKCGGEVYQRDDDNLESFENRYSTYLEKTAPLIDFYKEKGVLEVVKSNDNKLDTFSKIESIINE